MLRLTRAQFDRIVAHARREAPNECCGLLIGRNGSIDQVWETRNVDRSPVTFQIDPGALVVKFREMDRDGTALRGIYHSHPASRAWPSRTDIAQAHYPDASYVIVSLAGEIPEIRAFRIVDGGVEEEEVRIS
jgi:proteasome lid subunit RPN8/RPN11